MGAAFAQVGFQRLDGGAAQRDDALLVALAAHLHAAQIEGQIAGGVIQGIGGVLYYGLNQLSGVDFDALEPSFDAIMTCVEIMPDPRNPSVIRTVRGGGYLFSPTPVKTSE